MTKTFQGVMQSCGVALAAALLFGPLGVLAQQAGSAAKYKFNSGEESTLILVGQAQEPIIELAQIAVKKSTNADVRNLAQRILADITTTHNEVVDLAASGGVSLEPEPQIRAMFDQLKKGYQNSNWNRDTNYSYVNETAAGLQHTYEELGRELHHPPGNRRIRAYTQKTYPIVKADLELANQVMHKL